MSERETNRVSHQPDWMISGLLKAALFPEEAPDQPLFNTGVTLAQVRDQVRALLTRSGLDLTTKEIGAGTHWLTQRIANNVSESDTKESLMTTLNEFVAQYVVDKSTQRATGVSERGPIYDRKWYDKNFTPPTDRKAAAEEKAPEGQEGAEPMDMVYLGLDGDDMGHLVEDSLLTDDPEIAARISNSIHDAHRAIRKLVAHVGGRLIFDGGDNMLFYMPNVPDVFETIAETHQRVTKHSCTIGVGRRPIEAHYALVVGKNTGKDKVVIYDEAVKGQHETIKKEQDALEETEKKLKYRASALDMLGKEVNVADRLKEALRSEGRDSSDKNAHDLFWRLVQKFNLEDLHAIDLFFAAADVSDLVSALNQVHAKRMDWNLRCSEAREMSQIEGQNIVHDLMRATEAVEGLGPKFKALMNAVDSQDLRDLDEGMECAWARAEIVMTEFAKNVSDGKTLRYSHYADEVPGITAEIASMAIPMDQELMVAIKAVGNAEDANNSAVNLAPLIKVMGRWIDRVNALAMCLDMVCVVSGARPMEMVAADANSQPVHFPGQTNMPGGVDQKSPHKGHDWLTIEDYNREKVDWRKTDDQYVSTNVSGDPEGMSQKMVGGDVGGNPIYVP